MDGLQIVLPNTVMPAEQAAAIAGTDAGTIAPAPAVPSYISNGCSLYADYDRQSASAFAAIRRHSPALPVRGYFGLESSVPIRRTTLQSAMIEGTKAGTVLISSRLQ